MSCQSVKALSVRGQCERGQSMWSQSELSECVF